MIIIIVPTSWDCVRAQGLAEYSVHPRTRPVLCRCPGSSQVPMPHPEATKSSVSGPATSMGWRPGPNLPHLHREGLKATWTRLPHHGLSLCGDTGSGRGMRQGQRAPLGPGLTLTKVCKVKVLMLPPNIYSHRDTLSEFREDSKSVALSQATP